MEQQFWLMRHKPRPPAHFIRCETAEASRTSQGSLAQVFAFAVLSGNSTRFFGLCTVYRFSKKAPASIVHISNMGADPLIGVSIRCSPWQWEACRRNPDALIYQLFGGKVVHPTYGWKELNASPKKGPVEKFWQGL